MKRPGFKYDVTAHSRSGRALNPLSGSPVEHGRVYGRKNMRAARDAARSDPDLHVTVKRHTWLQSAREKRAGARPVRGYVLPRSINPATGRRHSDDHLFYKSRTERRQDARQVREAVRRRPGGTQDPARAWETSPDAYRSGPTRQAPLTVRERADRVLGPGRSARAAGAWRQARHDPWAPREHASRGRSR